MPGYIKKLLHKYKHKMATKPQHCPYSPAPKQYGVGAQTPLPNDDSPKLSTNKIKEIQQIVGSILYTRNCDELPESSRCAPVNLYF